jgi:glycerophosphoryl diester phosphodiesterase
MHAPVFIQSLEVGNLKQLHTMTQHPLIQLINEGGKPYDFVVSNDPRTYADLVTPAGLAPRSPPTLRASARTRT